MKKILALTALLVSVTGAAHASDQKLIECRGSILKDMSVSENYTVILTDSGDVRLQGQYKNSRDIVISASADVLQNDGEGLHLEASKKRMGMVFSKQVLSIDYSSGKGYASDYSAMESLMKPKMVYLDSCTRL